MTDFLRDQLKSAFIAIQWLLPDEWAIQISYFRRFHRFANLREPKSINEKVNWRKLHQRDPRFTLFSDKVAVKDEVSKLIGSEHVIPTLWAGDRPEDIPFDDLPPPYVIKVNHAFGKVTFVRRRDDIDRAIIIADLKRQLSRPHGRAGREWGYYDIPRKVLIEKMVGTLEDEVPHDYKFFVYHGRALYIQVDTDRWRRHARSFYDREWRSLPIRTKRHTVDDPVPQPPALETMIRISERIGSLFDFVRIDLYATSNKVLFGEATFYPSCGYSKKDPEIWNEKFGEPWKLPLPPK